MGYHSELMISMWESPQLSGLDKNVCADCVVDESLASIVTANLSSNSCSYCGEENEEGELIAAPYDLIMERVYESIFQYYADAQDVDMPWVEKEWLMPETNIWDVMGEFDPGWSGELCEDLIDSSDASLYLVEHVKNDWSVDSPSSALSYGWSAFKDQVLYKTRYLFLSEPEDEFSSGRPDYIPISSMLDALGALCNTEELVTTIPAETEFYRVRVNQQDEEFTDFSDIGVPPEGKASAGRMNPAGISYFYVAYDQETAEKEVITDATEWSIAKFKLLKDIKVIDFVDLPKTPSVFEPEKYDARQNLSFLRAFVKELTLPVSKDGREHVEYVPTQIISEYFRFRFKTKDDQPILGLRYRSVKNPEGINIAVFDSNNESLNKWFELLSIEKNC
ncbi:TPA: RES family NAD+ phosphorylase [Vibrio parahaemolyticus]|uniref:RES domain-containing protein n=1 Tax=Vibrio astriarenae TaxID=1481923 RepID=A0A7Z2T837_9VIBR|nr:MULTISPECIES: HEPN-associated N-terminal domain-containing protein [Vibrio]MCG9622096.1 RES domain-containing protein [Vibrio diabolicus]EIO3708052.1 RES domain-containing protein [Vibrio parahaemolyticus]EJA7342628.1 RES domain-containing protein [Vibrio parahaemolyticus]MBW6447551.1 RES domain-containing protein [Vibrio parahaemolyticus]MBY3751592.1 RES family NAD+ phosphorylase [Vibrio parahaemolyticus]